MRNKHSLSFLEEIDDFEDPQNELIRFLFNPQGPKNTSEPKPYCIKVELLGKLKIHILKKLPNEERICILQDELYNLLLRIS